VHYLDMFGVIDENGRWVLTPHKDEITVLQNHFLYRFGSEKGIISREGVTLFRSQNDIQQLGDFFVVRNRGNKYVLLDQTGNRAITEAVDSVYFASPSLYVFQINNQWSMLNSTNMRVVKLRKDVQQILTLSEGLIMSKIEGHWGFLKEDGELSIANRYDSLQFYSEGLAPVELLDKWGFIDKDEKIIIQPNYDFALPFKGNLSIVKKAGHFGMINNKGTIVLEVKYDKIEQSKDYILLFKNNLIGLANSKGELQRNIQYSSIEAIDETHFLVLKNGKYGVISNKGTDIIPTSYDQITLVNGKFLVKESMPITNISIN
jgi:WG repeat protein